MKKLGIVFKFEFKELITKKPLIITTLVMSLILFAGTFAPRVIALFDKDDETTDTGGVEGETISLEGIVLVAEDASLRESLINIFSSFEDVVIQDSTSNINQDIENDVYKTAYVFESLEKFEVIQKDSGLDFMFSPVESILRNSIYEAKLQSMDINPLDVYEAQDFEFDVTHTTLGRDASQMVVISFAVLFVLYMLILLYGQQVATSVAKEKDSRTMELLITSTDPKILILGKVFSAGLVGFLQIVFMIVVIIIGFNLNKSTYPPFIFELLKGSLALDVMAVYAFFSFAGYILYLFVYAALGSLVSKVEDVGSAVGSITFVFVIAYLIASMAMTNPDMTLVKVGSYIPFISLFTTPIRYSMTSVSSVELLSAASIMLLVTVLTAYLSVYIYRLGSLNYGNRMKLGNVIKNIIKK